MITCCIILNYNDSLTTKKLVNLIVGYNELDFIVIVDNCSTENSYSELMDMLSEKVHILKTEKNGGYGYGNNWGIRYSRQSLNADYVLIANPDVEFSNKCVTELKKILHDNKEAAIASAIPLKSNGSIQGIFAWKLPKPMEYILNASVTCNELFGSGKFYHPDYFKNSTHSFVEVIQGSMLMADAKIMFESGLYDEEFFLYEEEQVLGFKMKSSGYRTIVINNLFYIHHHSVSISKTYSSFLKTRKLLLKSKLLYLRKYLKANIFTYTSALFFFKLVLVEAWVISQIKRFSNFSK
jgi:N-acetylglucosaminyl-diphospho-decaprenol L-rhamnosyltransferase